MDYETIEVELGDDHVLTVTLNRPEAMNAFNPTMTDEFERLWQWVRYEDDVHVVVLQANGDRAFCTGVDVKTGRVKVPNLWSRDDPGVKLGPKSQKVWKPIVAAVHGMAAGGAFYWLNEADIVICSDDATFFDPHVTYGMVAALEPIGLARRIPYGEVMRIALTGLHERIGAERAYAIGLVSEVTTRETLRERARELAAQIASAPPAAIQGTVRAVWESLDVNRQAAIDRGLGYTLIGSPDGVRTRDAGSPAPRPKPRIR